MQFYKTFTIEFEEPSMTEEQAKAFNDALNARVERWEMNLDDVRANVGIESNNGVYILSDDMQIFD
jgi:hypothetical protein